MPKVKEIPGDVIIEVLLVNVAWSSHPGVGLTLNTFIFTEKSRAGGDS